LPHELVPRCLAQKIQQQCDLNDERDHPLSLPAAAASRMLQPQSVGQSFLKEIFAMQVQSARGVIVTSV